MTIIHTSLNNKNHFLLNKVDIHPDIQFKLFTEPYLDQVVEIFTKAFCLSEPMTAYLKMDMSLYKNFAYAVAKKAIEDKLSVLAFKNNELAAFALVEDLADPCPIPDFDPKFKYILKLLEQIGETYFTDRVLKPREISHLFITAVDEKFRGQKLSTQVNFQAMNISAQAGFSKMYCEFTHYYNEEGVLHHLLRPHSMIGTQVYRDFTYGNEKPFKELGGHATSYLWEL